MAIWTTPKTWVVGDVLTAADMNVYVRDNTTYLHDSAGFTLLWDSVDSAVTLPAASITTPTLAQTYKHLLVEMSMRSNAAVAATSVLVRFNADTGANYNASTIAVGTGAVGGAANGSSTDVTNAWSEITGASATANSFSAHSMEVTDYANTSKFKSGFYRVAEVENVAPTWTLRFNQFQWRNAAAISTISFAPASGSFVSGTRISVYGKA